MTKGDGVLRQDRHPVTTDEALFPLRRVFDCISQRGELACSLKEFG